jgi:hypothetical protein
MTILTNEEKECSEKYGQLGYDTPKEEALDSLERTDRCRFTGKAIRYG